MYKLIEVPKGSIPPSSLYPLIYVAQPTNISQQISTRPSQHVLAMLLGASPPSPLSTMTPSKREIQPFVSTFYLVQHVLFTIYIPPTAPTFTLDTEAKTNVIARDAHFSLLDGSYDLRDSITSEYLANRFSIKGAANSLFNDISSLRLLGTTWNSWPCLNFLLLLLLLWSPSRPPLLPFGDSVRIPCHLRECVVLIIFSCNRRRAGIFRLSKFFGVILMMPHSLTTNGLIDHL